MNHRVTGTSDLVEDRAFVQVSAICKSNNEKSIKGNNETNCGKTQSAFNLTDSSGGFSPRKECELMFGFT